MGRLEKLVHAAELDAKIGYHSLHILELIEPEKMDNLKGVCGDHVYCWHILNLVTSL